MPEMGTSGLMSGEWKRSAWRDIQTPATERAGHSYGPPSRYRATPRLHNLQAAAYGDLNEHTAYRIMVIT